MQPMTTDEKLAQMQAGNAAALAAITEALIKSGAIDANILIASLQRVSAEMMKSDVRPMAHLTLDGLIAWVRRLVPAPPGSGAGGH